jgi:hypothetical protein
MHEFLPARQVLCRRHIELIANCEVCGATEESIKHVLMGTVAKEFWHQVKLMTGVKIPILHPVTWARDLLADICSRRDRAIIICGMWALWMMRNKRRHGEQSMTTWQTSSWVRDTAFDLWQIMHPAKDADAVIVERRWRPPLVGWVKCSTDAAYYAADSQGTSACVLRDHNGRFLAGQAKWYDDHCLDACAMEAMACRDALGLAQQCGVQKVHLETDCLELVQLWEKREVQRSAITTRKRSIGTSTLVPVKNEPALTCLNSVRRAR